MLAWLRNYPGVLERLYGATHGIFIGLAPLWRRLGLARTDRWLGWGERISKEAVFDCRMCGQCVLHSTGMTCPMTCPKNLRNGPCGGVRMDGHCEVIPEMMCVWVQAFNRSQRMPRYGSDILSVQPPLNRQLEGSSAWVNLLNGAAEKTPAGWIAPETILIVDELAEWTTS